ncbi:MAG: efflux RND transporter periplasmic adaptor subunit [Acidiferrobacter sp.]
MRNKRRLLFAIVVTLVVGIVLYRLIAAHSSRRYAFANTPIPVTVARATRRDIPIYLDALGTVQAYRTVVVQPMISGPMISVNFHQGQNVKKGQLLARIDPRPYQAALDQALAKLAQDRAVLAEAREDLRRYEMLVKKSYVSAQVAASQAATVIEDAAIVRQDEAAVESAQTNLSYTSIRAPINGRTGILQVNAGNIVSPGLAGGIVVITTLRPIYVLFSLPQQDLSAVQGALHAKSPRVFVTRGGARVHGAVIDRGVLAVLDNQINASTGTLTLKARFPNPTLALWPGAFVNVRLKVRTDDNVITVPSVAVRQGPDGSYVYLVTPSAGPPAPGGRQRPMPQGGGEHRQRRGATVAAANLYKVVDRKVTLGYSNQNVSVITAGLAAGDRVVTAGGSRLHNGAVVRIALPIRKRTSTTGDPAPRRLRPPLDVPTH